MVRASSLRVAGMLVAAWLVVLVGSPTSARSETIEFAVWFSDRDFYADHVRKWASEIDKRTEGRVKIKLHFSGALVAAKETVNAVRTGAAGGGTHQRQLCRGAGPAGVLLRGAVLDSRRPQDWARYRAGGAGAVARAPGAARAEAVVQLPIDRAGVELQQRAHQGGR